MSNIHALRETEIDEQIRSAVAAANEVLNRLKSVIDWHTIRGSPAPFYIRYRVKSFDSIKDKIEINRRSSRPDFSVSDVKDLVGVRFVSLYDEDIYSSVDFLLNIISSGCGSVEDKSYYPLFLGESTWDTIVEAKFFLRTWQSKRESDIYEECHKIFCRLYDEDSFESKVVRKEYKQQRFRKMPYDDADYSSMHVVVLARSYGSEYNFPIHVEFQMRTACEDIWAEISHQNIYKGKHLYLWSEELEGIYKQLDRDGKSLKKEIESLPSTIRNIRLQYEETRKAVAAFKEPNSRVHFSFILTCVDEVCPKYIGRENGDYFKDYQSILEDINRSGFASFDDIENLSSELKKIIEKHPARGLTSKSNNVVACLLAFERIRLRAILLRNFPAFLPSMSTDMIDAELIRLHDEFIDLTKSKDWTIKLHTLFLYWQYYILLGINLREAHSLLADVYQLLRKDESLPDWSIYKVIVPEELAGVIWQGTKTYAEFFAGRDDFKKGHLFRAYVDSCLDALAFQVEAFKESLNSNDRRGDLVFVMGNERQARIALDTLDYLFAALSEAGMDEIERKLGLHRDQIEEYLDIIGKFADRPSANGVSTSDEMHSVLRNVRLKMGSERL